MTIRFYKNTLLLIEPQGIEIHVVHADFFRLYLLIEPQGIEIVYLHAGAENSFDF